MGESSWNGYERNCFFYNVGDGHFLDVARATGGDALRDSRAVAIVDLDGDGRLDIITNNNNAPPSVFLNQASQTGDWLSLGLIGAGSHIATDDLRGGRTYGSPRDAVGTKVSLQLRSKEGLPKTVTRWLSAGSGYASQSPLALHFGLGREQVMESLEITWPSGRRQRLPGGDVAVNNHQIIQEADTIAGADIPPPHSRIQ